MVDGARDFRLMMTRQMVDAVLELTEYKPIFKRDYLAGSGLKQNIFSYENRERVAGETSWSFWKLFNYSIDGIVNFSDAPLTIASFIGAFVLCRFWYCNFVHYFCGHCCFGDPTSGWPSMVSIFLFIGGINCYVLESSGNISGKSS